LASFFRGDIAPLSPVLSYDFEGFLWPFNSCLGDKSLFQPVDLDLELVFKFFKLYKLKASDMPDARMSASFCYFLDLFILLIYFL